MLAIVLSGGGANGAYEVGALQYILAHCNPEIYCGVSVGAINAAFLAQYGLGREKQAIAELKNLWMHLKDSSIYKQWCYGLLWYLPALWKGSVYNTKPVRDLISGNLQIESLKWSGKKLRVVGVSLNTGECKMWTEKDNDIIAGVQASSSYPIFFSPIRVGDSSYSDGGLRSITPLRTAIDAGAKRIIVVTCTPKTITMSKKTSFSTLEQVTRTLDIMCSEINRDDLRAARLHNELAVEKAKHGECHSKRYIDIHVVQPEKELGDSLNFERKKNISLMDIGYADAGAVLANLW